MGGFYRLSVEEAAGGMRISPGEGVTGDGGDGGNGPSFNSEAQRHGGLRAKNGFGALRVSELKLGPFHPSPPYASHYAIGGPSPGSPCLIADGGLAAGTVPMMKSAWASVPVRLTFMMPGCLTIDSPSRSSTSTRCFPGF